MLLTVTTAQHARIMTAIKKANAAQPADQWNELEEALRPENQPTSKALQELAQIAQVKGF